MAKIYNRAGVVTATAGNGTITLGAALAPGANINSCGMQTFGTAGVQDGEVVSYLILDANGAWEYGTGTYTAAGTTLSRTLGQSSTGALLVLSGSAQVFVTARKQDIHVSNQTLTDGATVNWDMNLGDFGFVTLGGNRTLAAPTNRKPGEYYLTVAQDATGSRTLTWNAAYKWPNDVPPKLKTAASAVDVFRFFDDGNFLYGTHVNKIGFLGTQLGLSATPTTLTLADDQKIIINFGADRTVNLPAPTLGLLLAFWTGSGILTIDTPGAESINTATGAVASLVLPADSSCILWSDGSNWIVIAESSMVVTADIVNNAVTYAKIQDVSATDKVLGRASAGAGDVEEIACTAAGRALIDDANAAAQRTTLGLGTASTLDETTAAQYRDNTAGKVLSTDKVWSAADIVALTDGANIAVNMANGFNFSVTLGGNRTLDNPTNTKNGQTGVIIVTQDATGSRTLAYGTNWEFAGGTAPTLSTAANAKDMLFYFVQSSTSIIITGIIKAVA